MKRHLHSWGLLGLASVTALALAGQKESGKGAESRFEVVEQLSVHGSLPAATFSGHVVEEYTEDVEVRAYFTVSGRMTSLEGYEERPLLGSNDEAVVIERGDELRVIAFSLQVKTHTDRGHVLLTHAQGIANRRVDGRVPVTRLSGRGDFRWQSEDDKVRLQMRFRCEPRADLTWGDCRSAHDLDYELDLLVHE